MTTNTSTKLSNKAMLVNLNISQWTARKYDRKVTKKIEDDFNTHDSGRFNKILIAQEKIKGIQKVAGEAREYHYEQTLPWGDNGARILPASNYMDYTSKIREFKSQFESEVSIFLDNYPTFKEDAKQRLNGMFKEEDYPGYADIVNKYNFSMSVLPMPDAEDFRVDLQGDEVSRIQHEIELKVQEAQANAMKDLWDRLYEKVKRMADKLSDEKGIFRDTLVQNTIDLCNVLPRLNITNDQRLEEMRREVETKLCGFTPQELRDNKHDRAEAAKDAQSILDSMAGYVGQKVA